MPVRQDKRQNNSYKQCEEYNKRCVYTCKTCDELINIRLAGSGILYGIQNTCYHRLFEYLFHTHLDLSRGIYTTGADHITNANFYRYRLTCDSGCIQTGLTFNHNTIQRHTVTRAD